MVSGSTALPRRAPAGHRRACLPFPEQHGGFPRACPPARGAGDAQVAELDQERELVGEFVGLRAARPASPCRCTRPSEASVGRPAPASAARSLPADHVGHLGPREPQATCLSPQNASPLAPWPGAMSGFPTIEHARSRIWLLAPGRDATHARRQPAQATTSAPGPQSCLDSALAALAIQIDCARGRQAAPPLSAAILLRGENHFACSRH